MKKEQLEPQKIVWLWEKIQKCEAGRRDSLQVEVRQG